MNRYSLVYLSGNGACHPILVAKGSGNIRPTTSFSRIFTVRIQRFVFALNSCQDERKERVEETEIRAEIDRPLAASEH